MSDHYQSLAQIEQLVERFFDCTLPCEQWTHEAHLTVGLWVTRECPIDTALDRVRRGIQAHNAACHVPTTQTSGYHETLTCFYMRLIGTYWARLPVERQEDLLGATNAFIRDYGQRDLPLAYYSRERLMSADARARWMPPDLRPLELIPPTTGEALRGRK